MSGTSPVPGPAVEHIFISPDHNFVGHYGQPAGTHPALPRESVRLVAGRGIKGDRYAVREDGHPRQITFFDMAVVDELARTFDPEVRPEAEGIETGDRIEISGPPDIRLAGSPEIPGGEGTIALAVNMVPRVLAAAPGLHSMADLPVPAAIPVGDPRPGDD